MTVGKVEFIAGISAKCEFRIQIFRFLALRTSRTVRSGTRFSYELHHFSGDS